ncbi:MAG TPA: cation diffusion facilitator family transporter [Terriglobales bacterium]|nr:cation diffusion facilitator family transporter [Terriglobales bacterium]
MTLPFRERSSLTRFAWLSIAAALATIGLKTAAYLMTGSVGLLSDALESFVNLVGALMALSMLSVAARPPDEEHPYGHDKAEYFSSGVEGSLILIAALSIGYAAVGRLLHPRGLEQIGLGLAISVGASFINLGVALVLIRVGKRYDSITLEANAHHLLTDVWTSVGVVIGVGAVALTGWGSLDPIVALLVAANIVWAGSRIVRRSVLGLMDTSLSPGELDALKRALQPRLAEGVVYHALRTRQAGARRFVSLHVLVPGQWSVHQGHELLERIEADIRATVPNVTVDTHLESLDDPSSWDDMWLDREGGGGPHDRSAATGSTGAANPR